MNNNLVGAPLGDDVEIECLIEAFPESIIYWKRISAGSEIIVGLGYRYHDRFLDHIWSNFMRTHIVLIICDFLHSVLRVPGTK